MVARRAVLVFLAAAAIAILPAVLGSRWRGDTAPAAQPLLGTPGAPSTSREDLARTIATMDARLRKNRSDAASAVALADALLRQTRVTGNAGLAIRAEQALRHALESDPMDYEARRMLGTVLLSQHRFREALVEAERTRRERPDDVWNDGVIGDAHLELGEYDEAFAAFDRMMNVRPSAAAYARASYARELQGDLEHALKFMKMSAEATSASDPEAQAWHEAQIGHLAFELGHIAEARRHYERAEFLFPGHPFAADGMVRALTAEGNYEEALGLAKRQFDLRPSPEIAAAIGDLSRALGDAAGAERAYAIAESAWRYDAPQPAALARFLADHDRNIPEAVTLATRAATERHDIFTIDALAWSLFKAGRLPEALTASRLARRTGTRDRHILAHAAAIEEAAGHRESARSLAERALAGHPRFDLQGAEEARAVGRRLVSSGTNPSVTAMAR